MARTVLLADDSVTAQNMGRRILMDAGYEVITVNNGSAALKKIHENQPDLIVLDVYMPGYGGLEVCQRLKESGETQRIPVLLTVGKMEPFKSEEAKRVRADGHIVKPFEASELLAALTKLEDRIVPQAQPERPRAKKAKAEKRARFWHAADPATTFDDSQTESINYLSEVKERQSQHDDTEPAPEAVETQSTEPAPTASAPVQSSLVPQSAAELPVIADAVEIQHEFAPAESAPNAPAESVNPSEAGSEELSRVESPDTTEVETEPAKESPGVQQTPAQPPVQTSRPEPRWVAQNVPLTGEESSISLEQEMLQARAATQATPTASSETESGPPREEKTGAAFAAAAAAATSAPVTSSPALDPDTERMVASEAAAAWQNWQQIRESVMSTQTTEALANSAAEATPRHPANAELAPPIEAGSDRQSAAAPALEGAALASIVDSVLAELKPKLMEEIAKKLKK
ncbi:MAG TPA: response regulator [Terriglobales bacterium]